MSSYLNGSGCLHFGGHPYFERSRHYLSKQYFSCFYTTKIFAQRIFFDPKLILGFNSFCTEFLTLKTTCAKKWTKNICTKTISDLTYFWIKKLDTQFLELIIVYLIIVCTKKNSTQTFLGSQKYWSQKNFEIQSLFRSTNWPTKFGTKMFFTQK